MLSCFSFFKKDNSKLGFAAGDVRVILLLSFVLACGEKPGMFALFFSTFCSALIQFWKSAGGSSQTMSAELPNPNHTCMRQCPSARPPDEEEEVEEAYLAAPYMSGQHFLTPRLSFPSSAREKKKKRQRKQKAHTAAAPGAGPANRTSPVLKFSICTFHLCVFLTFLKHKCHVKARIPEATGVPVAPSGCCHSCRRVVHTTGPVSMALL